MAGLAVPPLETTHVRTYFCAMDMEVTPGGHRDSNCFIISHWSSFKQFSYRYKPIQIILGKEHAHKP
jgi:hypothetical protein